MFKSNNLFDLAVVVIGVVIATKVCADLHAEVQQEKEESGATFIKMIEDRWSYVTDKLTAANPPAKMRNEIIEYCYMLLNRHVEFYCTNQKAKTKAHEINDRYYRQFSNIWK